MATRVRLKIKKTAPRAPQHGSVREEVRAPQHEAEHDTPRRTRQRKMSVTDDIYFIPVEEIPEGSSYEWKRWSNLGLEDPFYIAQMRQQGWEPVDPKRHPNWVPPGYNQPHIIKGGQILMERPMELTLEARRESKTMAKQQVREAEQRLGMAPKDTGTRDLAEVRPRVQKEIGRMVNMAIED